jgi:RES domain-containing protein
LKLPGTTALRRDDTHRLIPTKYIGEGEGESVLARLTVHDEDLDRLLELEGATNDRLLGEAGLLPGISVHELVFGISNAHIVNAAFTHAHPMGSRFNQADRGAWYAAFALETSQAEVAFHKAQELQEINWQDEEVVTYADYLADFRADFHDIRGENEFAKCLDPDSYQNSQRLARGLLKEGSPGIVYPSVRHKGGSCLACFRPALVINVRRGPTVALTFKDAILARTTEEKD